MATETIINYFDLSNERVFYPGTAGYQRRKFDKKTTTIHDLRGREKEFTLEENGFAVLQANWSEEDVEDTPEHIKNVVFPETIQKVKEAYVLLIAPINAISTNLLNRSGATDVICFSHLIRRHLASAVKDMAQGKKDNETVAAPGPTIFAHCDNSKNGALTVLEANVPEDQLERRKKSRWGIMNVWRPLVRPVTREPLAILDAATCDEQDLIGVLSLFPQKKDAAFGQAYPGGKG